MLKKQNEQAVLIEKQKKPKFPVKLLLMEQGYLMLKLE